MSQIVEKTGKNVEEAIQSALDELQCTRDEAEIEVLAESTKGLWGILGSKDAKVRVWKREDSKAQAEAIANALEEEAGEDAVRQGDEEALSAGAQAASQAEGTAGDKTMAFISTVVGLMGIEAEVGKKESEESVLYTLNGPRMGLIIGRRGETLDALQYLSNIVAGREKDIQRKRIVVDAEDYRSRREETLVRLATRLATKAKKSGRRVVLEPMNPQERRIIHTTLEKDPDVRSLSEGEEPYRRLVIYPTGGDNRGSGDGRNYRGDRYDRTGRDDNYSYRGGGSSGQERYRDEDEDTEEDSE